MIGIVDYGMGNIKAFSNIYKNLKFPHKVVRGAGDFDDVTKVILPGVGAFDYAMEKLEKSGMKEFLEALVQVNSLPVLGICVGMQVLANTSDEGSLAGLGWIDATVNKFDAVKLGKSYPLPHMGWNSVRQLRDNPLFRNIEVNSRFYFLHSYYFNPLNKSDALGVAKYGGEFTCAVNFENIFGVQFHPEKSHQAGIQLLRNFGEL
ncbi:MAG TPA: imidazole glycerol phosphate synthase subunit HisH [Gammaproteobacteria bacterium]|nr:imidazole glycerol phosphate synthase subunit HisH [Gammaproteobacteria bacterium]